MECLNPTPAPLYERLGGQAAVRELVHRFYERVVVDDALSHHFRGIDIARLARHQTDFLLSVLGGPKVETKVDLAAVHRRLGITPMEFDRVADHLAATLLEAGCREDDIGEVLAIVGSVKDMVCTGTDDGPLAPFPEPVHLPKASAYARCNWMETFDDQAIALFDAEGRVRRCNRVFARWFGEDRTLDTLVELEAMERAHTHCRRYFTEVDAHDPVLGELPVSAKLRELDEGVLFLGTSLTRRKESEAIAERTLVLLEQRKRDLEKTNAQLRAAQEQLMLQGQLTSLGEVAARTLDAMAVPLQYITTSAALLVDEIEDPDLSVLCENVVIHSQKASRALESLQAVSPRAKQPRAPHHVRDLVDKALSLCAERARELEVALVAPSVSGELLLNCRQVPMCHALLALVNNALDAVDGEDERWVRVEIHEEEHDVVFAVVDSGMGVPSSLAERIFEPFFTGHDGAGIGLSTARQVARSHGGELVLDVAAERTTFVLKVPK